MLERESKISKSRLMKYKVNFLPADEDDLFVIYKYFRLNDSKSAAEKLLDKLYQSCATLWNYPKRGHCPPEMQLIEVYDYLEIHYKPYRIIYQVIKKQVFVHCILDGRRDMQKLLQERLLKEL
jgi:toxin ParE1/3/4